MSVDPDTFVKLLSAVASTLSLASSTKNLMKTEHLSAEAAIERLRDAASPQERIALSDPLLVSTAQSVTVISDVLLTHLAEDARHCELKHVEALKKARTDMARHNADERASRCVCNVLQRIIRHNNGRLPDDPNLKNWWIAYRCAK